MSVENPSANPAQEAEPVLSYEQFSHRNEIGRSTYRNFWMYFSKGIVGEHMRMVGQFYQRFSADTNNQKLKDLLKGLIAEADMVSNRTDEEIDQALYQAYVIMKGYGATDEELFR